MHLPYLSQVFPGKVVWHLHSITLRSNPKFAMTLLATACSGCSLWVFHLSWRNLSQNRFACFTHLTQFSWAVKKFGALERVLFWTQVACSWFCHSFKADGHLMIFQVPRKSSATCKVEEAGGWLIRPVEHRGQDMAD